MHSFTTDITHPSSLKLQLLDLENGSVEVVAINNHGISYVLGTFIEGEFYLDHLTPAATELLGVKCKRHDNAMYLSVQTVPPPP